ncbi:hypothetical protein N7539_005373 [Penicillium diatomitis]|uniref:Uncharacterized protein n=1 Tax=Penicillium diatomitis TaxID=2819901 RepID=A0A9X0BV79_9EURO|nr:uncharacterized protein N7539_005373 [Penicillium diatomitis]KAJ5485385.1 hypothetical protein N7539_005373 [Penicillium diatomitis]
MPSYWFLPVAANSSTPRPAEPPTTRVHHHYGTAEDTGAQILRWMENPRESRCYIRACQLTLASIRRFLPVETTQASPMNHDLTNLFLHLQLAPQHAQNSHSAYILFRLRVAGLNWLGYIGPDVIIMEDIHHMRGARFFTSEISIAFYREMAVSATRPVRFIFATYVVNEPTTNVIARVYAAGGLAQSTTWWRAWDRGSSEFNALLGSRIGQVAAFIVLGGYARGTRRIARIFTISVLEGSNSFTICFEVEGINR